MPIKINYDIAKNKKGLWIADHYKKSAQKKR